MHTKVCFKIQPDIYWQEYWGQALAPQVVGPPIVTYHLKMMHEGGAHTLPFSEEELKQLANDIQVAQDEIETLRNQSKED